MACQSPLGRISLVAVDISWFSSIEPAAKKGNALARPDRSILLERAAAHEAAGRFTEAAADYKAAIRQRPKDTEALLRLAQLYNRKFMDPRVALGPVMTLLKLAPNSAAVHQEAAETYFSLHDGPLAVKHADLCVKLGPRSPDGLYVAATIYQEVERYADAIACMDTALSIRPDHLQSRLLLASSHRAIGHLAEAEAICRDIFKTYPDSLQNLSIWRQTCKQTADDPIYLHIRDVILPQLRASNSKNLPAILKILGKAENDIGDYGQAFLYFKEAKDIGDTKHDRGLNRTFVSTLIRGISKADYFGWTGNSSDNPVFIVGMPRSGSTLMEQILSSHPQIDGIGESNLMRDLAHMIGFAHANGPSAIAAMKALTPARAADLAEKYLAESRRNRDGALRIVNKNLHNFELLWLIGKLFPKARVLNAMRDPMDNCVSCYLQPLNSFHSYTRDLTSMGQYYTEYRQLMTHWKSVVPNPIMEVPYEDMVVDTEGMARKVIEFIGLEWDDACLDFQTSEKRVKTLSVAQVRQPIYATSVQRWKRYEAHLEPLKKELAGFYPDGF
jgi:tetratricopeptide (TPR) repeat protein